jgi:TPR repeat protein
MPRPAQFIVRPGSLTLVAVLAIAPACSRTNASSDTTRTAAVQAEQQSQSQPANPPIARPPSEFDLTVEKAQSGDAAAMYRLGRMYATGAGVEKDSVEAFNWYKRAAKAGNTDAMYALGEAYEHGTGVREDIQQAVNWYDQATLRGNKAAKAALDRLGEDFDR